MTDLSSATDEDIAQAVQMGDTAAFGHIIDRYQPRLERYAKRFLALPEDRDDQIQEVFMKVFINIRSFDVSQRFSPWIYRIAHNTFVNELRRRSYNPLSMFDMDIFFPQFMASESADADSLRRELGDNVEAALGQISDKYRAPLILFFYEGLSYQEIADVLQIPIATVGVRISRGKKQLKEHLKQRNI